MYTGKLVRAARRVFIKADNDNPDNPQLFNFDEFSGIHDLLQKYKRLGKVGSWKYFTVESASILQVFSSQDCSDCLIVLQKKCERSGAPYQYVLGSYPENVHLSLINFKDAMKETDRILDAAAVKNTPAISLQTLKLQA